LEGGEGQQITKVQELKTQGPCGQEKKTRKKGFKSWGHNKLLKKGGPKARQAHSHLKQKGRNSITETKTKLGGEGVGNKKSGCGEKREACQLKKKKNLMKQWEKKCGNERGGGSYGGQNTKLEGQKKKPSQKKWSLVGSEKNDIKKGEGNSRQGGSKYGTSEEPK